MASAGTLTASLIICFAFMFNVTQGLTAASRLSRCIQAALVSRALRRSLPARIPVRSIAYSLLDPLFAPGEPFDSLLRLLPRALDHPCHPEQFHPTSKEASAQCHKSARTPTSTLL